MQSDAMMIRTRFAARMGLVVALIATVVGASDLRQVQSHPTPGGLRLLPGYMHKREMIVDALYGRIWKPAGPDIVYEISGFKPNLSTALGTDNVTAIKKQIINGYTMEVISQKNGRLAVMYQDANFEARNVRTPDDVIDILLMVATYSTERVGKGGAAIR